MAASEVRERISCELDIKMRAYLYATAFLVFSFGAISGASIHTLIEAERDRTIFVRLISMPMHELAEYKI